MHIKLPAINKKHLLGIFKFAKDSAPYHKPNGRTISQIEEHIIIGKIAEYLLYISYPEQFTIPDFKNIKNPDAGHDLIHLPTKLTIDVKAQFFSKYFNLRDPRFLNDAFALFSDIEYNIKTGEMSGIFYGFINTIEVKVHLKESEHLFWNGKLKYTHYVWRNEIEINLDLEKLFEKKLQKSF